MLEKKIQTAETLYSDFNDLKELYKLTNNNIEDKLLNEILQLSKKVRENSIYFRRVREYMFLEMKVREMNF